MTKQTTTPPTRKSRPAPAVPTSDKVEKNKPRIAETGGPAGLEPTRYGDWERNGRCIDF